MSALVAPPCSLQLSASILAADFACLGADVEAVLASGADRIHFDVMDNHYVPNLSVGPMVCAALRDHLQKRRLTPAIDVHLMVEPVDELIAHFLAAGATSITFHPETSRHVDRSLRLIREGGAQAGLALNPATPIEIMTHLLAVTDRVLVMSVNPGFGGQAFIPETMAKLRQLRDWLDRYQPHPIQIEIDGGVNPANIAAIRAAGAVSFVAGSALFGARRPDDPHQFDSIVAQFRQALDD